MATDASSKSKNVIFICSLLMVVGSYAIAINAIPVLLNSFVDEFGLVSVQQGMMSSMMSAGSIVSAFVVMMMLGRMKKTRMVIISAVLQAVMLALIGFSSSFVALLAMCAILGLGCGMLDGYANSCMGDVGKGNSAKYMGILHGFFGVGSIVTPILLFTLLPHVGWRGAYFTAAAITAVAVLQFTLMSETTGKNMSAESMDEPRLTGKELKAYFKERRNWMLLLAMVCYSGAQNGLMGWIVRYMTVRYDAEALGATSITIFWVFATISRFGAPKIKMPPIKQHIWGTVLSGIVFFIGIFMNSAIAMLIASAAIGLLSGHCFPMLMSEGMSRYRGRTALPTSVMFFFARCTWMVMPLVQGALTYPSTMVMTMLIPAALMLLSSLAGMAVLRAK